MIKRKNARTRGKTGLSKYFKEFNKGDRVAIVREQSLNPAFPIRIQGQCGVVLGMKGRAYIIKAKDRNEEKIYTMMPMHLKKLA